MPKVKKSTKKDPPEKVLADLAKKYPQLLNLTAPPQKDDKLRQGEERSVADKGKDVLRALSQPLNYMREVGEGNYVPTQAELESKGISPMEQVGALANPMDHIYATLAMAGVVDDQNFDNENSTAALLGLVTGSAGQRVPKALEKTVKLLRDEGVKTTSDIKKALASTKAEPVVNELKKIKEKASQFSSHVLDVVDKPFDAARAFGIEQGSSGNTVNLYLPATNYMIEKDPDALLNFSPEKFDAGYFDKTMQRFADDYLTGFRAVKAGSADNAKRYITNSIGSGAGGRNSGPGLYSGTNEVFRSPDIKSQQASGYGKGVSEKYGDRMGVIRIAPEIGSPSSKASDVLRDLQFAEISGNTLYKDPVTKKPLDVYQRDALHEAGGMRGIYTRPDSRVSRSGTDVNLLDYGETVDERINLLNKYKADYYGASWTPYDPRGLDLLPRYNQGGKFKVKKKAQEGMRVKKSNGDPPKGYKRDADGYLTPVDFNEFHEMPSDSLNVDAIKKGISMAESIGGVLMMNPTSTATGMYGQRYSEIKDLPFMKGISREEFAKDLPLQEKVFEMRMDEGIGGPSLRRNAMELTEEYAPQLGDDWNFSLDDVAFLSNFLGRQRTREYFASRRDGTKFSVPGTNKTVDEYLKIARGAAYKD